MFGSRYLVEHNVSSPHHEHWAPLDPRDWGAFPYSSEIPTRLLAYHKLKHASATLPPQAVWAHLCALLAYLRVRIGDKGRPQDSPLWKQFHLPELAQVARIPLGTGRTTFQATLENPQPEPQLPEWQRAAVQWAMGIDTPRSG